MVGEFALTKYLLMADVVVSDTSSAIYEALLMDKPVITLNAISKDLYWKNITDASQLCDAYDDVFTNKEIANLRKLGDKQLRSLLRWAVCTAHVRRCTQLYSPIWSAKTT